MGSHLGVTFLKRLIPFNMLIYKRKRMQRTPWRVHRLYQLGLVVGVLKGSTAIQKDLNKLEKRAGRHLTKFNSDKHKVLQRLPVQAGGWPPRKHLCRKALGSQKTTDWNQKCPQQLCRPRACWSAETREQVKERDHFPLFNTQKLHLKHFFLVFSFQGMNDIHILSGVHQENKESEAFNA